MSGKKLTTPRYFGRTLRTLTFEEYRITEKVHEAGDRLRSHAHELAYATFVMDGGYEETRRGRSDNCTPGTLVFHPSGERHANRFGNRNSRLVNVTWLTPKDDELLTISGVSRGRTARRLAVELRREMAQSDTARSLALECILAEIAVLGFAPASGGRDPAWLMVVEERIRDEYLDEMSLRSLALDAGVHRSHLARAFRLRYGESVGMQIRRLRVEWARERLRLGASIAEVAFTAGFADQSHLTRWFRKILGSTPADWQRRKRLSL